MPSVEAEGKTVEEAVAHALVQLGLTKEQVYIEVLSEANRKLFGLLGTKGCRVKVTPKEGTSPDQPQEIVENLLRQMEIKATLQGRPAKEGYIIDIISPEGALLIGRGGRTLEALQYLANRIYHRRNPGGGRLFLDIGGYREKREETLIKRYAHHSYYLSRSMKRDETL